MNKYTQDSLFNGRIRIDQPASGYRFSADAVILANIASSRQASRVCDIGTGCGIVPLVMAYRNPSISVIFGIEIQHAPADTALRNTLQNGLDDRIRIIRGDARTLAIADIEGPVDLVVCNPPHCKEGGGRLNPCPQKATARHEITLNLESMLSAAGRLLAPRGRLMVIYPALRITDLLSRMRRARIEPRWLRFVHPSPGKTARRVVVEGVSGGGAGASIAAPLYITDGKGRYSSEMEAMYRQ